MAQQVKRIIKCFCGCSQLTEDEVKIIVQCNIEGFVKNETAKKCFKAFIEIGHSNDTPLALQALECYEMCEFLLQHSDNRTSENYYKMLKIHPNCSRADERRFCALLRHDESNLEEVSQFLDNTKYECKRAIESDFDYERFKKRMLEKIKK